MLSRRCGVCLVSAVARVTAAYAAIDEVGRREIWITLRPVAEALAEAGAIDVAVAAGERLPLAGLVVAVKDNIDVAGLPTTAAAPSYAYLPERDATCVARLREAGAVVIGKTNLDQFATGLVGTRSPYGAVRNAWDPARISGGSSSGSAVAVALGLVDFALGTDTAGSGRVPAALNGIVGLKPTRGVIPCTGVVPACRSLDCVTVFAASLPLARRAVAVMAGPDGIDPLATLLGNRPRGGWQPGSADAAHVRIAVPLPTQLAGLAAGWAEAFDTAVARLRAGGAEIVPVDIAPLLEAASLLYGGAFVAERYAAVGVHVRGHADLIGGDLDPVVAAIILDAAKHSAVDYIADRERLDQLAARAAAALDGCDALLTPTTTLHPSIAEVREDPVGVNARLGTYTNFANLLDLAALAVPAGTVAGLPFGIMLTGPAASDARLAEIATRHEQADVDLLVVGAHLTGQPLNHELLAAGGMLLGPAATAPSYRLYALDTRPPKPGLVRVDPQPQPATLPLAVPQASGVMPALAGPPAPCITPPPPGWPTTSGASVLAGMPMAGSASAPGTMATPAGASAPDGASPAGGTLATGAIPAPDGMMVTGGALPADGIADGIKVSDGASIVGEVWRLPAAGFARFMTGLAAPMAIGRIRLDDGRDVLGFLCEPAALHGAADITSFGGWRAWIARSTPGQAYLR